MTPRLQAAGRIGAATGTRLPDWVSQAVRVLSVAAVATLIVLSWLPRDLEVRTGFPGQIEHVAAYAGAAALAALAFPAGLRRWLGLGLVGLAGLLEVGQIWIPGRISQVIDFAASSAGVPIGICVVDLVIEPVLRRIFGTVPDGETDLG